MKRILCTCLASLLVIFLTVNCQQPNFFEPHQLHLTICYNDTSTSLRTIYHPPQNLDFLLAIIEKIESHTAFSTRSPKEIALFMLRRFRIDGMYVEYNVPGYPNQGFQWKKESQAVGLEKTTNKILFRDMGNSMMYDNIELSFLTDTERCGLHWMLSHGFNLNRRGNENVVPLTPPPEIDLRYKREVPRFKRQLGPGDQSESPESKFPLETGIISTPFGTVAAGTLLVGVASASSQAVPVNLAQIFNIQNPGSSLQKYQQLDPRYNVLGCLAAAGSGSLKKANRFSTLGPKGWWNSRYCPNEFTLSMVPTIATDADVYGTLDGFFIATKLPNVVSSHEQLKLSHILRMYYNRGLFGELRGCNRFKMLQEELANPKANADFQYNIGALMLAQGYEGTGIKDPTEAEDKSRKITELLNSNYTTGGQASTKECIEETNELVTVPYVDLYFILDTTVINDRTRQNETAALIGEIGNLLDISPNTSHIGIYMNDVKLFDEILPMNLTLSEAELKCKVLWLDFEHSGFAGNPNIIETVRRLKRMFTEQRQHEENGDIKGTPAKVVVFFLNAQMGRIDYLGWEMDLFRTDHPEVVVLAVGSRSTQSEAILRLNRVEDLISYDSSDFMTATARKLYERLERVGSLLYVPQCWRSESRSIKFSSVIGNNTRRFHTLPSKMFNISTNLRIQFRTVIYRLNVCYSRDDSIFKPLYKPGDAYCVTVEPSGSGYQSIDFGRPCDEGSSWCSPIHLRIETDMTTSPATRSPTCSRTTVECRTADQGIYGIEIIDAKCRSSTITSVFGLLIFTVLLNLYKMVF